MYICGTKNLVTTYRYTGGDPTPLIRMDSRVIRIEGFEVQLRISSETVPNAMFSGKRSVGDQINGPYLNCSSMVGGDYDGLEQEKVMRTSS